MSYTKPQRPGLVLLLSLLTLASVGVVVVLGLSTSAIQSVATSRALLLGPQARQLATACAEQGLDALRQTPGAGSGNLTLTTGTCTYTTTEPSTSVYRIIAVGTAGDAVARSQVDIPTITPSITIGSWQDI